MNTIYQRQEQTKVDGEITAGIEDAYIALVKKAVNKKSGYEDVIEKIQSLTEIYGNLDFNYFEIVQGEDSSSGIIKTNADLDTFREIEEKYREDCNKAGEIAEIHILADKIRQAGWLAEDIITKKVRI